MQKSMKKMLMLSAAVTTGVMAVAALALFGSGSPAQAQTAASPEASAWDHRGPITGTMRMTGTKPFTGTRIMPGFNLTETLVMRVDEGSPAATAGIVAGDTILKVDDAAASPMALQKAIKDKNPGDTISLLVRNADGATRTLEITLADNPNRAGEAYLGIAMGGRGGKGGRGGMGGWEQGEQGMPQMPRGQRGQGDQNTQPTQPNQQTPGGRGQRGGFAQALPDGYDAAIMIVNVTANSPAANAGLASRDLIVAVDGKAPTSAQAFVDAIGAKKVGDKVALKVYNPADQTTKDITVTLGESATTKGKAFMGVTLNGKLIQRIQAQEPVGAGA